MNIFCSICLDHFTANCDASVTSCGHLFHSQCIARAFGISKSCPQCRSPLTQNFNRVYLPFESETQVELTKKDKKLLQIAAETGALPIYKAITECLDDKNPKINTNFDEV